MSRSRIMTLVFIAFATSGGALSVGCSGSGAESGLVRSFFQASRFGDRTTLGSMAMVVFSPEEDGLVSGISVESVTEEKRRALRIVALGEALAQTRAEEEAFRAEKKVYQDENFDAITRVIEAERAQEDAASRDQEVQEMWTKWRAEERQHALSVSEAQTALSEESQVAEVSVFDPGNPIDVSQFEGELISKDVTITADVEMGGTEEERTMVITMQKVELQGPDGLIEGRWIITAIS